MTRARATRITLWLAMRNAIGTAVAASEDQQEEGRFTGSGPPTARLLVRADAQKKDSAQDRQRAGCARWSLESG